MVKETTVGAYGLTALVPDKENKRVFISNRNGQVYVFDISSVRIIILISSKGI